MQSLLMALDAFFSSERWNVNGHNATLQYLLFTADIEKKRIVKAFLLMGMAGLQLEQNSSV